MKEKYKVGCIIRGINVSNKAFIIVINEIPNWTNINGKRRKGDVVECSLLGVVSESVPKNRINLCGDGHFESTT